MDKQKLLEAAIVRKDFVNIGDQVVTVREMGTLEFTEYGELVKTDKLRANAKLIALSVIDENGQPVLSEEEAMEFARVVRIAIPIVTRVMELSEMISKDKKETEKHSVAN